MTPRAAIPVSLWWNTGLDKADMGMLIFQEEKEILGNEYIWKSIFKSVLYETFPQKKKVWNPSHAYEQTKLERATLEPRQ